MKTELGHTNWDTELQKRAMDIDMQWIFIKKKVQEMIESYIPTRKIRMKKMKNKYHGDEDTIEIIRKKHRAWQRYKESGYLDEDQTEDILYAEEQSEKCSKILSEIQGERSSR